MISTDGRYIAFTSSASNLVRGDTNGVSDVFVRDLRKHTTQRVSVGTGGRQADQTASAPSISADGRYVAFSSWATGLVPGDTNERGDIFVRDRRAGTTVRVSLTATGGQAANASDNPAISADGRYIAFSSNAENLVAGDDNGEVDVFVHDRRRHLTQRVSVSSTGTAPAGASTYPVISANGRYVAFMSQAPNVVADGSTAGGVFLRDLRRSTTVRVSRTDAGAPVTDAGPPAMSGDGRYVTFSSFTDDVAPGDHNGLQDVVVRDLRTSRTKLISVSSAGVQGDEPSAGAAISPDGRYVTFLSWATNLVPGDRNGYGDIFLHDRRTGTTERVSVLTSGAEANSASDGATVSAGGRTVAMTSYASNLAPGDTDHAADVFVWSRR
ncbi:TolB family protein [Krasilnikovia sp. M28-CT-15]|uniref:TolB family protein n=1 Tax=Krasilnikovia sp. M28-CT-15 TaxID=3373540 RepID=UPI00399CD30E